MNYKTSLCLFALGLFCQPVFSQKINADKVPAPVVSNFEKRFPGAEKVRWHLEGGSQYEVSFKRGGKRHEALFQPDGVWLETEIEIPLSHLPAPVVAALDREFAGFEREEAEMVEMPSGVAYELDVEKGKEEWEVMFSADGKLLKKEAEDDLEEED